MLFIKSNLGEDFSPCPLLLQSFMLILIGQVVNLYRYFGRVVSQGYHEASDTYIYRVSEYIGD